MQRTTLLVSTLLAAIGLAIAVSLWQRPAGTARIQSGTLLSKPQSLPRFNLIDHHDRPFTRQDFSGQWSLLFTGFTSCPDVCPTTLFELNALDERLRAGGTELQTIFLSVDPDRDTPDVLAPYVEYFGPNITGATGELPEITRLCDQIGVSFVHIPGAAGDYTVEHSGALLLIDPRARISTYFKPPFDLEHLSEDLRAVVD